MLSYESRRILGKLIVITALLITFTAETSALSCQQLGSGHYFLTSNISSSSTCFEIAERDVVLDGKGFWINGTGNGSGIFVNNTENVTLTNISLKTWDSGIRIDGSRNITITGIKVLDSNSGIFISNSSAIVNNSMIQNNTIGISINKSSGKIYNNLFNNSKNFELANSDSVWNTTKRMDLNIVNGHSKAETTGQICQDLDLAKHVRMQNTMEYAILHTIWTQTIQTFYR